MVFKVQVSIGPGKNLMLAYDERNEHVLHMPTPPALLRLLNGRPKAFFEGRVINKIMELKRMLTDEEAEVIAW
jgi:hypothetical protein